MRLPQYFSLIVILFLFGCTGPASPTPTAQRKPVILPPTWTPTASLIPSLTPKRSPTHTFTPLPSATLIPATLTTSPTSNIPTPTRTSTITPTLVTDCYFWALKEGVSVHSVPFDEAFRLQPTMIPSVTYQAITYHPTYYELVLDDEVVGWVDYRSQSVWSEGPGCSNLPFDDREWMDFPGTCFFTTDGAVDVYEDSALIQYYDTFPGGYPHRILLRYKDVYYSNDAMGAPHIFVDASQVQIHGDCESIPRAGRTIADVELWSHPNGQSGHQVNSLATASRISIQEGPVAGPKPPGASESGSWYLVRGQWHKDGTPSGWIWSSYFRFE